MPHFDLLIIGDEILSGKRTDRHFTNARNLFNTRGLALSSVRFVGDDKDEIADALCFSRARKWRVISCGGIGATPDDHTRQAAAIAFEQELQPHLSAQALIRQRINSQSETPIDFNHPDMQRRLEMGVFPVKAQLVPNPYNGIAGFSLEEHYFIPGFPVMAEPMMAWILDTYYVNEFTSPSITEHAFIVFEVAESLLTPLMLDIETLFPGIKVFSLPTIESTHPTYPRRHIELGVKRDKKISAAESDELLIAAKNYLEAELRRQNYEFIALPQQPEQRLTNHNSLS